MIKLNDKIKVNIIDLDYKGDGIAKIDDFYLYIKGALKGELVLAKITQVFKNYANGIVLDEIEKSRFRVRKLSNLGSLNLMHLAFTEQLNWQKEITKNTLNKVLNDNINVLDTITDNNEFNYRNKVVYHVFKGSILKLGLFNFDNSELIIVNDFILANKETNKLVEKINNSDINIEENVLSNIVFKNNSNNEILVTITSKKYNFKGLDEITKLLKNNPNVKGLTINIKVYKEKILSDESKLIFGTNVLEENNLLISDLSFMQVNLGVMHKTYNLIKENIKGNNIIDAYGGIGSIGYSIIDEYKNITIVDNNKSNIDLANIIKTKNNYNNVITILGNSEDVLKDIKADSIIVDPPRKGLMSNLIDSIIESKIDQVIYLSCDLQTLARDLKLFSKFYIINQVYPIRMFPQTNSFETLVIMSLNKTNQ